MSWWNDKGRLMSEIERAADNFVSYTDSTIKAQADHIKRLKVDIDSLESLIRNQKVQIHARIDGWIWRTTEHSYWKNGETIVRGFAPNGSVYEIQNLSDNSKNGRWYCYYENELFSEKNSTSAMAVVICKQHYTENNKVDPWK